MPARARAAISTFRELRTAHSVVVTEATSEVRVVDLDADEDQSGCDGGDAGRPGEGGGCDGHVRLLFRSVRGGRRGDAWNLGSDGVTRRHHMM